MEEKWAVLRFMKPSTFRALPMVIFIFIPYLIPMLKTDVTFIRILIVTNFNQMCM